MDGDGDVPKRKVLRANKKPELWQYMYMATIWGLMPVGCHYNVKALFADEATKACRRKG